MSNNAIPSAAIAEIDRRLSAIEQRENVRLLLAVESGSRAWGFPSPDSDYDVRFIYVRPVEWYLRLTPGREVIETPIEHDMDINGWDLRKALSLLLKSNAVLFEWLASPIQYRGESAALAELGALADRALRPLALGHHYLRLLENNRIYGSEGGPLVALKKYFYALRPALALRALRLHPQQRPPMALQQLMEVAGLPQTISAAIDELVARKRETRELGAGARVPVLDALIAAEHTAALPVYSGPPPAPTAEVEAEANALFLRWLS